MLGVTAIWKRMFKIWDIPSPTNRRPKNHLFGRLCNLTATLTAYIFGTKHDKLLRSYFFSKIKWRYRQSVKCADNYKGSPTLSQNVMNFGPQTASNWIAIFTHLSKILRLSSFPGVADTDQQTELNQSVSNALTICCRTFGVVPRKNGGQETFTFVRFFDDFDT